MDELYEKVEALLLKVAGEDCDPKTFLSVRNELVQMVVVSVSPPLNNQSPSAFKDDEDFSDRKEFWIAR